MLKNGEGGQAYLVGYLKNVQQGRGGTNTIETKTTQRTEFLLSLNQEERLMYLAVAHVDNGDLVW